MGLTKRPDSYYVEFRVIDSPRTEVLGASEWCARCAKETVEGWMPQQDRRTRDGVGHQDASTPRPGK